MSFTERFRTPEGAARFRAVYEANLSLWPVAHEALDVETSFGVTHINAAGSPDLPPLMLIHGAQASSTQWYPNVAALSQHFRLYAPDVIDQMGLSLPTRRLKTPQDCADWLTEILDALKLERTAIAGHSQGGWQALNMAILHPERVERLALLSPAPAFARLRWQLLMRMLPVFVMPTKGAFYWCFQAMTTVPLGDEHPMVDLFMTGAKSYKPRELNMGVTSVFSDDELRGVQVPTLLLVGDHEIIYDPKPVLERARRLMPHIEAELISGGHLFPVDQSEATNKRLLEFLKPEVLR